MLIGISRPEKKNCVDSVTAKELIDAFTVFEKDENVLSGVLYGKGGSFCAGYDLSEVATSVGDDGARLRDLLPPYHEGHGPMVRPHCVVYTLSCMCLVNLAAAVNVWWMLGTLD